jgi:serine/threonine-protein kinase HipA
MARPRTRIPLNVYPNARLVGQLPLALAARSTSSTKPAWLSGARSAGVALLPCEDRYTGDPVIAVSKTCRTARGSGASWPSGFCVTGPTPKSSGENWPRLRGRASTLPEGVEPEAGRCKGRPVGEDYIARKIGDLTATPLGVDEDEEFEFSRAQEKTAFVVLEENGTCQRHHGHHAHFEAADRRIAERHRSHAQC